MKKRYLLIIPAAIVVPIIVVSLPWAILGVGLFLLPNPPAPEIRYGEFPFQVVYELNGEQFTVEDTLICEFDGYGVNEGAGKYREWTARLASGNENVLLFKMVGTREIDVMEYTEKNKEEFVTEIFFDFGKPGYYMGETEVSPSRFPEAGYIIKKSEDEIASGFIEEQNLMAQYGVKLLQFDIADPIQNNFN